ncbi:peptide ABC transporter ATP-binding protein [Candidatus Magnetomorum sp. HK-1]|nr:peptide ABC transporter ATP-binding protein [Candidatus Magnetomorum sp. HK-1]
MIIPIIKRHTHAIRLYIIMAVAVVMFDLYILISLTYILGHILPAVPPVRFILLFVFALMNSFCLYMFSQKKAIHITESIISETREQIIEQIRKSELQSFEKLEKTGAYNVITMDTQIIADSIVILLQLIDYSIVCIGILVYFLFISQMAFWFTLSIFILGGLLYSHYIIRAKDLIHKSRKKERELFGAAKDLIEGFKELKSNDEKNDDFFHHCLKVKSAENRELKIKAEHLLVESYVHSIWIEFGVFIPIVFIMPAIGLISYDVMISCITLILFLPFGIIKDSIPYLVRASVSVERLLEFENDLNELKKEDTCTCKESKIKQFSEIKFNNITFHYTNSKGNLLFGLQNMTCSFYPGEIVFIIGGNGSGKSTLLKVLTGLYFPFSGNIKIDEKEVQIADYRFLFSAILSDFHLFDRFYGFIDDVDQNEVKSLLKIMELDQKITIENNRFSTLDLSTGQRKRLAMLVAIMEDKPIYVFDEWAADQSPRFREFFYHYLLPSLRKKGKTVIAVTHDDQYFNVADRILKLDYGRLI